MERFWFILILGIIILLLFVWLLFRSYRRERKLEYEFTSIANHAFRTPLTRINWISKELEKDLPQKEKMEHLQSLENANSKLLEIVDQIVGLRNIESTSGYFFKATSLRDIIENSFKKYREEINRKNITFKVPSFTNIPMLTIDAKKIGFVIDTIVENAILYTPKDGKIFIECILKRKNLVLYVEDSGLGLSQKDKMNLFSRFYRGRRAKLASPDGMGLRLYLAKDIIERHHGKIKAKSKGINKGATFILKLPLKS